MRSRAGLFESACKVLAQQGELAFDAAGAADHDMVGAHMAGYRHQLAGERAEAPLHAIADDGLADLLADGEADALQWIAVLAIADEKDEARRRRAPSGVRSEEVRALSKDV